MSLETFTIETFAPCTGQSFSVHADGVPPVDMVLERVRELPTPGWRPEVQAEHRQPFALELSGPPGQILPQSTYRFVHHTLGPFEMFIVPVGQTAAGVSYEAVFS